MQGKNQTKKCPGIGFISLLSRGNASGSRKNLSQRKPYFLQTGAPKASQPKTQRGSSG